MGCKGEREIRVEQSILKTSDAHPSSQRGHSSRSAGKPRTGRRATPGEVASSQYAECEGGESWPMSAERERQKSSPGVAGCGESRMHGDNGGDGETGREVPRSVPTHSRWVSECVDSSSEPSCLPRHGLHIRSHGREMPVNPLYPASTQELPVGSIGCSDNHHLTDPA
jgi:hypothetical protein